MPIAGEVPAASALVALREADDLADAHSDGFNHHENDVNAMYLTFIE
jgi:hypothetical protein